MKLPASVLRHVMVVLVAVGCASVHAADVGNNDGAPAFVDIAQGTEDAADAVALQPDGKIVLAGSAIDASHRVAAIVRLLPDGSPDPAFASGGQRVVDFGFDSQTSLSWVGLMPDGRILAVGSVLETTGPTISTLVVRLLANGEFDTTFSIDGRALFGSDVGAFCDLSILGGLRFIGGCDAELLPDGNLVIVGASVSLPEPMQTQTPSGGFLPFPQGLWLMKVRPDATLDPAFGSGGMRHYTSLPGHEGSHVSGVISVIERRADGRLVLAMPASTSTASALGIMQVLPNGTPDGSFGSGGGTLMVAGNNESILPIGMQLLRDDRIALGLFGQLSGARAFIAGRLLANGQPDTGFGSGGLAATNFALAGNQSEDFATSMHVDSAGRTYIIGSAQTPPITGETNIDVAIARFTLQGLADTSFGTGGRRIYGWDISAGGGPFYVLEERALAATVDGIGRLVVVGAADAPDNADRMQVQRIFTDDLFRDGFD